jgi:SAM-dependent methyltransferase
MPDHRYWDAVFRHWNSTGPDRTWRRHSDVTDSAWLSSWLPTGRVPRLLKTDLFNEGIGPGLYPLLSGAADRVYGVDLSPATVGEACARFPGLTAAAADVRRLPFSDGVFDLVVSNSTLDHFESVEDIPRGLAELYRVLRGGGLLLLSLDNGAHPLVALRNKAPAGLLSRLRLVPYYVGATYGPRRLKRVLQEVGFTVEAATTVMHVPRVLAVAGSRIVERLGSGTQELWLRTLGLFERLGRLPTRNITGHFVVAKARKVHA